MALPVTIPNEFANATASIPLSQLDTNFTTLANAVNGISDGSETLANASVTVLTAGTANVTTLNTSGQVVFNDAGADVDFRVEGDTDANLLFVDASTDRVGVGTNTPGSKLEVNGGTAAFINTNGQVYIQNGNTSGGSKIAARGATAASDGYLAFEGYTKEYMRIDSSGNVGIGTAPSSLGKLSVDGNFVFGPFTRNEADTRSIGIFTSDDPASNDRAAIGFITTAGGSSSNSIITFSTNDYGVSGGERMRIDSSGNLLVEKTALSDTTVGAQVQSTGRVASTMAADTNSTDNLSIYSTGASAYRFFVGMGGTVFATNTTISSVSDVRYKENIRDLDVGLAEIMQLQPRVFDWKEGKGKNIQNDRGFIAQEVEQVFPDLIDEWKDPAPEGEEPYKSVRQDLIPVLVKAIQELKAELDEAKARIAALENA
jgi:hypothetical protein